MTLIGHVAAEMTVRYAALADAAVPTAYGNAMATLREGNLLPSVAAPATAPVQ